MKWKIVVKDSSSTFAANSRVYDTQKEAEDYGHNLAARWSALQAFAVVPVDLKPDVRGYYSYEVVKAASVVSVDYTV